MKVLITGGAGFIGSHVAREVLELGFECHIVDDLSRGMESRIPGNSKFEKLSLCDSSKIKKFCKNKKFDYVIHLAGYMQARESARAPRLYWENNFQGTNNLLEALSTSEKSKLIFSSSCSVYGNNPAATERSPLDPLSVYAETKLKSEEILRDFFKDSSQNLTIFRFFNVIGCRNEENLCDIQRETLLPSSARKILQGERPIIFGNNYNTRDGFALREYVDVRDIASAIVLPLKTQIAGTYNLSSGKTVSTREILGILAEISGRTNLNAIVGEKRAQDPSIIGSQRSQTIENLGWSPMFGIEDSVANFWKVFSKYFYSHENTVS